MMLIFKSWHTVGGIIGGGAGALNLYDLLIGISFFTSFIVPHTFE